MQVDYIGLGSFSEYSDQMEFFASPTDTSREWTDMGMFNLAQSTKEDMDEGWVTADPKAGWEGFTRMTHYKPPSGKRKTLEGSGGRGEEGEKWYGSTWKDFMAAGGQSSTQIIA